jgi:hypothetical protein
MGNRVYEGRFKGSSLTHMPNDTVRENLDKMGQGGGLPSYVEYVCGVCGEHQMVHKLEVKVHRCIKCGKL